jgi:hypothetical protein
MAIAPGDVSTCARVTLARRPRAGHWAAATRRRPRIVGNPLHAAFAKIEIGQPQEFITDLRLMRR